MSELTNEQIAAGAAVLGDDGRPIGRNTAIMVADAMFPMQSPAPIHEQVAQASGIEGLIRYEPANGRDHGLPDAYMFPVPFGEYVKLVDVERILNTQSAKQYAQTGDFLPRRNVADEIVLLSNVMRDHPQLKSVIGREALLMRCVRAALVQPTATQASVEHATGAKEVTQQAAKAETIAKELAEQLRRYHELEIWDWDILLNAANMIESLAPTTSTVNALGALAAADEWSYSTDEERYHEAEPSRLAILQHALAEVESSDEGAGQFWIGRNVRFTGKGDAGSIIEALQEQAYDQCGAFAETYLEDVTPAEEAELESLVSDWAKRVDRSNFWTVTDVECFTVEEARAEIEALRTHTAAQAATDKSED